MVTQIPGSSSSDFIKKMKSIIYLNLAYRPCARRPDKKDDEYCFGKCRDCWKRRTTSLIEMDFERDPRFNGDNNENTVETAKEKSLWERIRDNAEPTANLTAEEIEQRIKEWRKRITSSPEYLQEEDDDDQQDDADENKVDIQGEYGYTQLHKAVKARNLRVVKLLVEKQDADPKIKDNAGNTPYIMSVLNGYSEIIKYFRSKGITS
jgi:ankyrin repeat protein